MVLETIFDQPEGVMAIVDYMPVRQRMSDSSARANLIRIVYGQRGRVRMRMDLTLRFDYGATVPWVTRLKGEHGIRAVAGPVEHAASIWTQSNAGIWEARNGRHQFTFSKVMAWVALDREIKTVERHDMPAPISRWRRVRAAIHADVMANGFNPARHSFIQRYGGNTCDASLLLLPMAGFIDGKDPRMLGTIRPVEEELQANGLVHRYVASRAPDGLPGQEATFLACSFWLADAYALAGRWNDARNVFERLLLLRNDVGLLAEEYDPVMCRMAGNFPQALSHIALVNTALLLDQHARLTR